MPGIKPKAMLPSKAALNQLAKTNRSITDYGKFVPGGQVQPDPLPSLVLKQVMKSSMK
jgi:hypothetical protein